MGKRGEARKKSQEGGTGTVGEQGDLIECFGCTEGERKQEAELGGWGEIRARPCHDSWLLGLCNPKERN